MLYEVITRRGGAIDRHQRAAQRRGHVHQPGVVGDHRVGTGQQVERLGQTGCPGQIDRRFARLGRQRRADRLADRAVSYNFV